MKLEDVKDALRRATTASSSGAAVLIPLVERPSGLAVILEVRALTLDVQPGEVCLPGGRIEANETPQEAAIRETCEELLVSPSQIEVFASLGAQPGPGGMPLHTFVGTLTGYQGTFSTDEVDHTFALSLSWLLEHEPDVYDVTLSPTYPEDYPWELVPGGRSYPWRARVNRVPFYRGTNPVVWGATARVLAHFAQLCRQQAH